MSVEAVPGEIVPCVWEQQGYYEPEYWETECGQAYVWFEGGLSENHYRFCPNCGRPIQEHVETWTQAELDAAEGRAEELGRVLDAAAI